MFERMSKLDGTGPQYEFLRTTLSAAIRSPIPAAVPSSTKPTHRRIRLTYNLMRQRALIKSSNTHAVLQNKPE